MKKILIIILSFAFVACVTTMPVATTFDAELAKAALEKGPYSISGSALMRQQSGGVVTCAGLEVSLIPVTRYADERMQIIYNNNTSGYNPFNIFNGNRAPSTTNPMYSQLQKKAFCNAQGFFKFDGLKNGSYYITTSITWNTDPYTTQGGALMRRVDINGADVSDIVLTPH